MAPERQRQILAGVFALLVLVVARQYFGGEAADAPATVAAAARRTEPAVAALAPVDVKLDALGAAPVAPEDQARNPFVFGAQERGPLAPTRRAPESAAPPPLMPTIEAPRPPPLPPIPFKFIGFVQGAPSARRIAVLSDSKGLVVHGAEGAIIDGQFRILSIGAESIDIAYADGRGRQTLRLSGQ